MALEYTVYSCTNEGYWHFIVQYDNAEEAVLACERLNEGDAAEDVSFYFVDVDRKDA